MNHSTHFRFSRRPFGRFLAVGALSTALFSPAPAAAVQVPVAAASEVEAAFQQFALAWAKEDLNNALAAFAADAVVLVPATPGRFENKEGIRTWLAGTFQASEQISFAASDVQVHVAGPMAWLTARYAFKAQAAGKPVGEEGNLSMVWVKQQDGACKIAVYHASIPPAAAAPPSPPNPKPTTGSH